MSSCKCGFTTDIEKKCNGTHKIVKAVREEIAKQINEIDLNSKDYVSLNALGMKMIAIKIIEGKNV